MSIAQNFENQRAMEWNRARLMGPPPAQLQPFQLPNNTIWRREEPQIWMSQAHGSLHGGRETPQLGSVTGPYSQHSSVQAAAPGGRQSSRQGSYPTFQGSIQAPDDSTIDRIQLGGEG